MFLISHFSPLVILYLTIMFPLLTVVKRNSPRIMIFHFVATEDFTTSEPTNLEHSKSQLWIVNSPFQNLPFIEVEK